MIERGIISKGSNGIIKMIVTKIKGVLVADKKCKCIKSSKDIMLCLYLHNKRGV